MAQFSNSDINEAKRRVMDMRNRANRYTQNSDFSHLNNSQSRQNQRENNSSSQNKEREEQQSEKERTEEKRRNNQGSILGMLDGLFDGEKDNSFIIILALILILNKEGADNKLILALLYLLL